MTKKNLISMILTALGGILFSIGMCMCLLPQWNAMNQGIVTAAAGAAILLIMVLIRRKMAGKKPVRLNLRVIGIVLFGILGALTLGTGMCMVMVFEGMMIYGIIIGVVGIMLLLCLVPMIKGVYKENTKRQNLRRKQYEQHGKS